MERCTLTKVARTARLSVATVSLALRNHPKIPAATTLRIQQIARKLGYKAHPSVAALMAHIRSGRQPRSREKIAFVWIEAQPAQLSLPFNRQTIDGARHRARQLGYELDEFWLCEPGMTSRRLSEILKARGITGIVFSGCDRQTGVQLEMDWAAHATAVIGNAPWTPELHRAGHYHFMSMRRVLLELARRKYRRPVLLLDDLVNERANRACEAAFVTHHPAPSQARHLLRKLTAPADASPLRGWLHHVRPDAIIVSRSAFLEPLKSFAFEQGTDLGCAALDLSGGESGISGIDPDHRMVAAHAVDLVIGQLFRNERDVPSEPKKVLFEGHWIEGTTLRAAPAPGAQPA